MVKILSSLQSYGNHVNGLDAGGASWITLQRDLLGAI